MVAALALMGCTNDGDALDLDDGDDPAAAEQPAPGVVDDGPTTAEDDDEEQLFPPLPPLEPDPESDVPVDDQEFFLELHHQVYEATQEALASLDSDLRPLQRLLGDPLRTEFLASVEERRASDFVSRSPDTEIQWVRVARARGGPAEVQECRLVGPDTGVYDASSGEPVQVGDETVAVILQTTYELVEEGDDVAYRAVEIISGGDDERCSS